MTDELASQLRAHAGALRAQADRYDQAADLVEAGDDADGLLAVPKRTKAKKARATKGGRKQTARPTPAGTARAERKARGLKLLADGKTPTEVAKLLGVSDASVYYWRKKSA